MRMTEWAKREVEIAKTRERGGAPEGEWDYGCACYDSAFKAFNCLMEDGHSGMSISITKSILNRLIEGKPLTPIEDTEDVWKDDILDVRENGEIHYQCNRMSSLFKIVYPDGTVKYKDVDRVYCVDFHNPNNTYGFGLATRIIDEMFPIEMPYISNGRFKVVVNEFLVDPKNGDFDTVGIFSVTKPDGEVVEISRFFTTDKEGCWVEITEQEYYDLYYKLMSPCDILKD